MTSDRPRRCSRRGRPEAWPSSHPAEGAEAIHGQPQAFEEAPNPDSLVLCYVNKPAHIFAYWDSGEVARRQGGGRGRGLHHGDDIPRLFVGPARHRLPTRGDGRLALGVVGCELRFSFPQCHRGRPPPPGDERCQGRSNLRPRGGAKVKLSQKSVAVEAIASSLNG